MAAQCEVFKGFSRLNVEDREVQAVEDRRSDPSSNELGREGASSGGDRGKFAGPGAVANTGVATSMGTTLGGGAADLVR